MNPRTREALFDELEKIAGIGSFLGGGLAGWKSLLSGQGGGLSGISRLGQKIYQKGARTGGMWGGVKNLAGSQLGQMAAVPLAGYGAYRVGKSLLGGEPRQ